MMFSILELKRLKPLAFGDTREVYQHPHAEHLLVKVMRFAAIRKRWGWRAPFKERGRYGYYILYHRELSAYFAIKARRNEHPSWLQRIEGFADTDLGWGMVVERLNGKDGRLAKSLRTIIQEGQFTSETKSHFDRFVAEIGDCDEAVISNLQLKNILLVCDDRLGERLVLVDGLGETSLVPLHMMFQAVNRRNTRKRIGRLQARLEMALTAQRANRGNEATHRVIDAAK